MSDSAASGDHLRIERPSEGVVRLVLDNPDQRNAMSEQMTSSWVRAIDEIEADRQVRVVVVTGEGSLAGASAICCDLPIKTSISGAS